MKESKVFPEASIFEKISCYSCGEESSHHLTYAEDDLTGKPGRFSFVVCDHCNLAYQNPRVHMDHIGNFYDEEYIAHRKKTDWGFLTPFYNHAMGKLDRDKEKLVQNYISLNNDSKVLDVGCGAGTFLLKILSSFDCEVSGVDFKDLTRLPGFDKINFHHGLFYEQPLSPDSFDLITMWHFLEHDYDPLQTLSHAKKIVKDEGLIIIEVPRLDSLTYKLFKERWPGLQAPQHTVLYSRETFLKVIEQAELEVVDYLPYGAFPAYFYLFSGIAFKMLKGKGLNLSKAILPYFLGQIISSPIILFEKYLNLSMQTLICKRPS